MLSEKENTGISKFLSLVLRHQPEMIGITLDEHGWVAVEELLEKANASGNSITVDTLNYIVETNAKKRFAFSDDGKKIRASQGHSISVDLAYKAQLPPHVLYHGTASRFVDSIFKSGLEKQNRQHVHLSVDRQTALQVGSRHGKPVVFKVLAGEMQNNGHSFYLSENNVWLTDNVPVAFLQLTI